MADPLTTEGEEVTFKSLFTELKAEVDEAGPAEDVEDDVAGEPTEDQTEEPVDAEQEPDEEAEEEVVEEADEEEPEEELPDPVDELKARLAKLEEERDLYKKIASQQAKPRAPQPSKPTTPWVVPPDARFAADLRTYRKAAAGDPEAVKVVEAMPANDRNYVQAFHRQMVTRWDEYERNPGKLYDDWIAPRVEQMLEKRLERHERLLQASQQSEADRFFQEHGISDKAERLEVSRLVVDAKIPEERAVAMVKSMRDVTKVKETKRDLERQTADAKAQKRARRRGRRGKARKAVPQAPETGDPFLDQFNADKANLEAAE